MRNYEDVVKLNSFQEICTVANEEQWCWNLFCGTCGHRNFVKSLALLINRRPLALSINGITRIPSYYYMKDKLLNDFSHNVQEKVKDVSIEYFANNFKYPDFLGYLGIALFYSQSAENENRILTERWIPQFIAIMNQSERSGVLANVLKKRVFYLENILFDNKKILTVKDLEIIERSCSHLMQRIIIY